MPEVETNIQQQYYDDDDDEDVKLQKFRSLYVTDPTCIRHEI